jgi:alpha/beta superfamily hydrolase
VNGRSERRLVDGPVGRLEVVIDWPARAVPAGIAHVAHPHPLYGGSLDNKVVSTLARGFVSLGWLSVRSNFRGVGASEAAHDNGRGELDDLLRLIADAPWPAPGEPPLAAGLPLALAGFSFGSFVAARAAMRLREQGRPARHLVLVGAAAGKWPMPEVDQRTLVIHGELDETIALTDVFAWARGSEVPVTVIPGADHFFHRRLVVLKSLLVRHLLGAEAEATATEGAGAPHDG